VRGWFCKKVRELFVGYQEERRVGRRRGKVARKGEGKANIKGFE
jgi:hypothetical protein